jgi:hypothetical protein
METNESKDVVFETFEIKNSLFDEVEEDLLEVVTQTKKFFDEKCAEKL